ncbi:hypothetical protein QJQ45_012333 [Haematococcus lacustris]|nr:hypothetical protein QJQ45_012333 [Haematococcus lacustris]
MMLQMSGHMLLEEYAAVSLQSDTANMADVFFGATAVEMHCEQQAGGAAVSNQDPAALVAHGQLPSLHACSVAAKQPTTPSQFADPALFSVQPHLAGTPVAIALFWLAGSRELLAEAIPLVLAFSQAEQVLSRLVTVDGSQADQPVAIALEQLRRGWGAPPSELLSRTQLLPAAAQLVYCRQRRSDKRLSLLLGRMWLLGFIYFNKRVRERRPKPQPEAE